MMTLVGVTDGQAVKRSRISSMQILEGIKTVAIVLMLYAHAMSRLRIVDSQPVSSIAPSPSCTTDLTTKNCSAISL